MTNLLNDLRYALRVLRKSPGFTAVALLSLALGIGANTAIFTLLNALLLRDLPVNKPEELVLFGPGQWTGIMGGLPDETPQLFSVPFFREIRESNGVFTNLAAVHSMRQRIYARFDGALEPLRARIVSGNYFATLGVPARLGRTLSMDDDAAPGGQPVAVLSYAFWKRRFAGDESIVGKKFTAGATVYTIVGVAAPEFFGTTVGESPDIWFPLAMLHQVQPWLDSLNNTLGQSLHLIGRLKPGISAEFGAARIDAIYHQWMLAASDANTRNREGAGFARAHIKLEPGARGLSGLRIEFSYSLRILMGVVGLVLLIACANVANLLLARAASRQREIAVRLAVGAGRWRLVRQLLVESIVLALAGGAAGVLVAVWGSQTLLKMVSAGPETVPLEIAPDARILAFAFIVSVLTGILFGLAPALRATRIDLNPALREGKGAAGATRGHLGKALVAGQVAVSLLLLIGAGLFLRTLRNLATIDTGFARESVLIFHLDTDYSGYSGKDPRLPGVYERIEQRVKAIPGVKAASFSQMNFGPAQWSTDVEPLGAATKRKHWNANGNVVNKDYFETMSIPIKLGRTFTAADSAAAPKVAVVNETFARELFPGESPIGRKFLQGDYGTVEIVGVAKDAKYVYLREKPRRMFYFPTAQHIQYQGEFQVRVAGDPAAFIPRIRQAIREAEPNFLVSSVTTMAEQVNRTLSREHLIAKLSTFFGALALILACVGLYGILSYGVARRTGEIGIRMALGANAASMVGMILRETMLLIAIGLAIGIPAALALTRLVKSMLYGVEAVDWLTIAVATLVMLAFAAAAAWLPARRAAKVDPMVALRYE